MCVDAGLQSQLLTQRLPARFPTAWPPRPPLRRNHRGLRHYWGLTVRGQHTKTTGRRGKTVGTAGKKK